MLAMVSEPDLHQQIAVLERRLARARLTWGLGAVSLLLAWVPCVVVDQDERLGRWIFLLMLVGIPLAVFGGLSSATRAKRQLGMAKSQLPQLPAARVIR
jgi:hypothetical protein